MTLTQGEFLFHYVSSDGVVALAIAGLQTGKNPYCELYLSVSDSAYDRGEAFKFLGCVLDKFLRQFGERVHTAIAFAMNTEFSPVIAR